MPSDTTCQADPAASVWTTYEICKIEICRRIKRRNDLYSVIQLQALLEETGSKREGWSVMQLASLWSNA